MSGTHLVLADRIVTLAPGAPAMGEPPADALLVRAGRVVAVGRADELVPAATGADVLDLRGSTITPGLTDAHIHLLEWALSLRDIDLAECRSPEACARAVARALNGGVGVWGCGGVGDDRASSGILPHAHTPAGQGGEGDPHTVGWVRGRGWNPHHWGGSYPHRAVLDAVAGNRPVVLQSHDMHALWANGRALAEAGIDRDTPDPAGGRIVRGADGEPTGVLLEMAAQLLARRVPPPSVEEAEAALLDGQRALHRLGITGVHTFPAIHLHDPDGFALLQRLEERDLLRLRVLHHIPLERLDDAIRLGLRSGFGGDWLRLGAVKLFLDGALGSRTALLCEPYEGESDYRGVEAMPLADFRAAVARAGAAGIAAAVHAIGDAAVARALDVLADPALAGHGTALPHRIEHLQLCPPGRLADAARAGIVASMQPAHLITDWAAADAHWGARARYAYAFRSLLTGQGLGAANDVGECGSVGVWETAASGASEGGRDASEAAVLHTPTPLHPHTGYSAVLAFGSDAPVEPVDPRLAFYAATTRQDLQGRPEGGWYPEQRIGMAGVLRAYTRGPALASGAAERHGLLAPGAAADFVAWDGDPLETEGEALLRLRCTATVIAGEVVWREGE